MKLTPARIASLLAGAAALLAGLAPAVANMDTTSTAGMIAGALGVVGVLSTFLKGQREHEARQANGAGGLDDPALDDPDFSSDEPEITDADLAGRAAQSTPITEHTGLGGRDQERGW